jgi:hypothetical protein
MRNTALWNALSQQQVLITHLCRQLGVIFNRHSNTRPYLLKFCLHLCLLLQLLSSHANTTLLLLLPASWPHTAAAAAGLQAAPVWLQASASL